MLTNISHIPVDDIYDLFDDLNTIFKYDPGRSKYIVKVKEFNLSKTFKKYITEKHAILEKRFFGNIVRFDSVAPSFKNGKLSVPLNQNQIIEAYKEKGYFVIKVGLCAEFLMRGKMRVFEILKQTNYYDDNRQLAKQTHKFTLPKLERWANARHIPAGELINNMDILDFERQLDIWE